MFTSPYELHTSNMIRVHFKINFFLNLELCITVKTTVIILF